MSLLNGINDIELRDSASSASRLKLNNNNNNNNNRPELEAKGASAEKGFERKGKEWK